MNAPDLAMQLERFLTVLEKLPPSPGLVFHGLPAHGLSATSAVLKDVVASSCNPRIATENFTTAGLACIVTLTGRNIAFLSDYPEEEETLLLPGVVLVCVAVGRHEKLDIELVVFEELDLEAAPVEEGRDAASARLRGEINDYLAASWNTEAITVNSPGKFTSPLPF